MKTPAWFAAFALFAAALTPAAAAEERLNIIVILVDDMGSGELGCYGHPEHRTPRLDALAKSGAQFATCYTPPICHPTRFQIMTGQYGHRTGVFQFPNRPGGPKVADENEDNIASHLTFGRIFQREGYATALAGKWQLSGRLPTLIRECGFDEYCMWAYTQNLPEGVKHTGGWEGKAGGKTSRYWHPSIVKNGEYVPTAIDDYGPDLFCDFIVDFLSRKKDKPFFVYYPMALTHSVWMPTPDSLKPGEDRFKHSKANYRANVEYTDKIVGRIVDALEANGLREKTVVLFVGDNGTEGNGKARTTELGARVPMIVNCPGVVKPVGLTMELCDTSDVVPTIADFAGIGLPEGHIIDGRSFAPLLRGEPFQGREWVYAPLGGKRVLRTERWLLEDNSPSDFGRLFDCGDSRDGTNYREVTDSTDPEVVEAKKRLLDILADKPVPEVADADPQKPKGGAGAKGKNKNKAKKKPDAA
ncbi:MAG: sulfatase-like hydrolase/transferase [Verrucomicrobiae bacterium]|nr:sulfatase-like hydrolase/transferase [Verrucomicrobiae bacterium]MCP5540472.1 sulfatase-like hydrolase/transferase [Akkermansiaceae bacterium]